VANYSPSVRLRRRDLLGYTFLKSALFIGQKCTLQAPRPWVRYLYGIRRLELVEDSVTVEKFFFGVFSFSPGKTVYHSDLGDF